MAVAIDLSICWFEKFALVKKCQIGEWFCQLNVPLEDPESWWYHIINHQEYCIRMIDIKSSHLKSMRTVPSLRISDVLKLDLPWYKGPNKPQKQKQIQGWWSRKHHAMTIPAPFCPWPLVRLDLLLLWHLEDQRFPGLLEKLGKNEKNSKNLCCFLELKNGLLNSTKGSVRTLQS